jgi:ubiquinol-cytochrome c reductase cytochrome c1 subunit
MRYWRRKSHWRQLSDLGKKMKKMLKTLATAMAGFLLIAGAASAAEGQKDAKAISYSFEGPFGTFDKGQLQRGYKVYKEVCSSCHSMKLVSFRNLSEHGGPGFSVEQVKALAATFTVNDGPGNDGEMFDRPGLPSDRLPSPFANEQAAAAANGGAVPPDLSLITKFRPGWYGTFNQLLNGIGLFHAYGVRRADGRNQGGNARGQALQSLFRQWPFHFNGAALGGWPGDI